MTIKTVFVVVVVVNLVYQVNSASLYKNSLSQIHSDRISSAFDLSYVGSNAPTVWKKKKERKEKKNEKERLTNTNIFLFNGHIKVFFFCWLLNLD